MRVKKAEGGRFIYWTKAALGKNKSVPLGLVPLGLSP